MSITLSAILPDEYVAISKTDSHIHTLLLKSSLEIGVRERCRACRFLFHRSSLKPTKFKHSKPYSEKIKGCDLVKPAIRTRPDFFSARNWTNELAVERGAVVIQNPKKLFIGCLAR